MRSPAAAWIVAGVTLVLSSAPLRAQDHAAQPAAKPAAARGPVVAPSKPVVAPQIAPRGDTGAVPTTARSAKGATISVSARQAAEQTIAALVAAMKNMPKRPPAPAESLASRGRGANLASRGQAADGPPPITYHVTWPATPQEPGLGRRVELDWPGRSTGGPVSLRWNEQRAD